MLITARTTFPFDSEQAGLEFFHNDERIIVALSRARHGMLVIADFPLLLKNDLWRRYLRAAVQTTPVVLSHYVGAMIGDERRDSKGILLSRDGTSIVAPLQINRYWL
ncbi:unnamed protein product [Gongylonema pulchrum]|uniref:AAA_12 domain-containing protein n=1 Tax=Gongylonema pulchrum TaxID=637853 RepID=A0A183DX41_9BILA|nr:unnamed protein product [Gongylonema pulchrum]